MSEYEIPAGLTPAEHDALVERARREGHVVYERSADQREREDESTG